MDVELNGNRERTRSAVDRKPLFRAIAIQIETNEESYAAYSFHPWWSKAPNWTPCTVQTPSQAKVAHRYLLGWANEECYERFQSDARFM